MLVTLAVLCGSNAAAAEPTPDPVALARAAFDRGLEARRLGDLPTACAAFGDAVDHLPVWPLARFEHAQCLRLVTPATAWDACQSPASTASEPCATRRTQALAALVSAGEGGIRSPAVLIETARVHEDAGDLTAARAAYAAAARTFPAEIRALEGLARTAPDLTASEPTVARTDLEAWLARSPHDPAALWRLAEVCEGLGDVSCAEGAWLRFADRTTCRPRAAALLRAFAERTGSRAAAERARKLAATPSDSRRGKVAD